jgi:RNA polymerase sigma-70 factor (ECF subfamily)
LRKRRRRRWKADPIGGGAWNNSPAIPESETGRRQLQALLEELVDGLPPDFRDGVRAARRRGTLHRGDRRLPLDQAGNGQDPPAPARKLIRAGIEARLSPAFADIFPFDGLHCVNMAERVIARLR